MSDQAMAEGLADNLISIARRNKRKRAREMLTPICILAFAAVDRPRPEPRKPFGSEFRSLNGHSILGDDSDGITKAPAWHPEAQGEDY